MDPKLIKRETGWEHDPKKAGDQDLELYVTVRIPPDNPEKMTVNLIGPLLVNTQTMEATQLVIARSQYTHRHKILQEEPETAEAK